MKTITKTKSKAISLAKETLRNESSVKRLGHSIVKNTACDCDCGHTAAIEVVAKIKGKYHNITVGYCSSCGVN